MIKLNTTTRVLLAGVLLLLATPAVPGQRLDGEQILRERLDLYRQAFPKISFEYARGGEHWKSEYARIASMLSEKPDALDYEYPPQFADDLMIVTMDRLAIVLRQNIASETLFRSDKQSALKGSMVCVITLEPNEMINNGLAPMGYCSAWRTQTWRKYPRQGSSIPVTFYFLQSITRYTTAWNPPSSAGRR